VLTWLCGGLCGKLFLIGSGRSGVSLVARCFGSAAHGNLFSPNLLSTRSVEHEQRDGRAGWHGLAQAHGERACAHLRHCWADLPSARSPL